VVAQRKPWVGLRIVLTDDGYVLALVGGDDPGEQLDAGERGHGDLGEHEVEGVGARPHDLPRLHPVRDRGHWGSPGDIYIERERETSESNPQFLPTSSSPRKLARGRREGEGVGAHRGSRTCGGAR
jgi:hypothetical protein